MQRARMAASEELPLGELLAALSLASDLGNDFPVEKTLRHTHLAMRLGAYLGLSGGDLSDLFYACLLRFVGCAAYAHEIGRTFGDDNAFRGMFAPVDFGYPSEAFRIALRSLGKGAGPVRRTRALGAFFSRGKQMGAKLAIADCDVLARAARRLEVGEAVGRALVQGFERWDGHGGPSGLAGEALDPLARVLHVAHTAELHHRLDGRAAARRFIARGAGGWFDPRIAEVFDARVDELLAPLESPSVWEAVLALEPRPQHRVAASRLDEIARVFGELADLKSPWTLGHSAGVAALAEAAGRSLGLGDEACVDLRRAGHLHDIGRVSVPNGIWDKPGPLGRAEWERVRMHGHHAERVLASSARLHAVARLCGQHHERLDGAGYHRGLPAGMLGTPARVLATADVYHALTEARAHRPPLEPIDAVRELERMASAGSLDRDAVHAVCVAAGQRPRRARLAWPAGLSNREVDVLRLLARGLSEKEIAGKLCISPGTVHTHVAHIYEKLGVRSRAGVAVFAMEHDLLRPDDRA